MNEYITQPPGKQYPHCDQPVQAEALAAIPSQEIDPPVGSEDQEKAAHPPPLKGVCYLHQNLQQEIWGYF